MKRRGGRAAVNVICAILLGALIAFLSSPVEAQSHSGFSENQELGSGHYDVPDHSHGDEVQSGHCHPGLDCSTVAAFPLKTHMPGQSLPWTKISRLSWRKLVDWVPPSDTPPPRVLF